MAANWKRVIEVYSSPTARTIQKKKEQRISVHVLSFVHGCGAASSVSVQVWVAIVNVALDFAAVHAFFEVFNCKVRIDKSLT